MVRHVKEYKVDAILAPVLIVSEVIIEIAIPLVMARLIDDGIGQGSMVVVQQLVLVLFGMACGSMFCGLMAGRLAASAATGLAKNLRIAQFAKIQQFSFQQVDKFSTASLITRMTNDVNNVQNAFQTVLMMAVRTPMITSLAMITLFNLHQRLSLIFLLFAPIIFVGTLVIVYFVHPLFRKIMKIQDALNQRIQENLKGIRVVKAFVQEQQEIEHTQVVTAKLRKNSSHAEGLTALFMPLTELCLYGATLLLAWFGAHYVVIGELSTGQLMTFFAMLGHIVFNLMNMAFVFVQLMFSQASINRIKEVLNEPLELSSGEENLLEVPDGSILFKDVTFSYGADKKEVLHNLNFSIAGGSTVGILGKTGSAKSSLVQLIARLYDVQSGRILVGGQDVRSYNLEALRNQVAMVLQKNELFSGSIAYNLRWGNEQASEEQLIQAAKVAQADAFVQGMNDGYESVLEQGATNLSGGQRQRLCIARALLKNPKILILDDSMSAVDTKTEALIRRSLSQRQQELTTIIISGRITSLMHADSILYLDEGKIVAQGSHEQLLISCQPYQQLCMSQQYKEASIDV
jgi:ATP-binding cassette, subfamily B, multidrug efflux pump